MKIKIPFKKMNNRGAILIVGYIALFALVALSSSVSLFNFTELNFAKRYRDSTAAFWLAESGIQRFLSDPAMLDKVQTETYALGRGNVFLTVNDIGAKKRIITSTGLIDSISRSIQIEYQALAGVFDQTLSIHGDLVIDGKKSTLAFNDKVRVSGQVLNTSKYSSVFFEDKKENINPATVMLTYPDTDSNGVADEFNDFVVFNRELIKSYAREDVVYLRGNGTYTITPDKSLLDKKIIFVDGDEGKGNVNIQFSGVWPEKQNMTIISTGTVVNNSAGIMSEGSQLNIIAWSGYKETAVLPSSFKGVIFTHGKAVFDEVHDTSITNGSVIANEGIEVKEVWSTKTFNYADTRENGQVPPGFEGLIGGGITKYSIKPDLWKEITL